MEGPASGQETSLICDVTVVNGVSPDLVMISWTVGGSPLSSSQRVNISNQTSGGGTMYTSTVTFSPILNDNGGQYICSVAVTGFDEASNSDSTTVMVNGMYVYSMCTVYLYT